MNYTGLKALMKGLPLLLVLIFLVPVNLKGDDIKLSPDGLLKVEKFKFGIVHWGANWKATSQVRDPKLLTFSEESGKRKADGVPRKGSLRLADNSVFDYTETINRISKNEFDLSLVLDSAEGVQTKLAVFETLIPVKMYKKNPAVFNDEELVVDKNQINRDGKENGKLLLKLKKGTLSIQGNFGVTVKENAWGVEVRLRFKAYGNVKHTELKLHMTYVPN